MKRLALGMTLFVVLVGVEVVSAAPITSITARNSGGTPNLLPSGLVEGVAMYSDGPPYPLVNIPMYLPGADLVQMSHEDKRTPNFELDITLSCPAQLYVFVNDVTYGGGAIPWMVDGTLGFVFSDTGDPIALYVSGDHPHYVPYSVYVADVPAGTVTLYENHTSTTNSPYGVAATIIPEPIPGDANLDFMVNDLDAAILATYWQYEGMIEIGWEHGDFNGDGEVTDADAAILATHWQEGVEGGATVPEPSTLITLLSMAVVGLLIYAWRTRR